MTKRVSDYIDGFKGTELKPASGAVQFGRDGPCRAINIRINGINLRNLTKAPMVTEDINRYVGRRFSVWPRWIIGGDAHRRAQFKVRVCGQGRA